MRIVIALAVEVACLWGVASGAVAPARAEVVEPAGTVAWSASDREREAPARPARRPGPAPHDLLGIDARPATTSRAAALFAGAAGGSDALAPSYGFLAVPDDNTHIPPDVMGAVGPSHVVAMLNNQVRIQDRSGSVLRAVSLATFWTAGSGLVGTPFDPRIEYDSHVDRWVASTAANARSGASQVWLAVSATSDPTGSWRIWSFPGDPAGSAWVDFPALGLNGTWIAVTANMFTVAEPETFVGAKMWVIDKASALAGGPLVVSVFEPGFDVDPIYGSSGFALQPAITFDAVPALYLLDGGGTTVAGVPTLRLSRLTGTGPAPVWSPVPGSPFAGTGLLPVANDFDLATIGAEQLGVPPTCTSGLLDGMPCRTDADCETATGGACRRLDTGDARLPSSPVFRNGRLWAAHSGGLPVGAVDRTAVFWYALDPVAFASSGAALVQSGVVDPGPGGHCMFPSIAVNRQDDAYLAFSRSDATRHPEAAATARSADMPPGTMGGIDVLKAGEDAYVKTFGGSSNRWGDYSASATDPVDDLSFWTIQPYAAAAVGTGPYDSRWGTWWSYTVTPASATTTTLARIAVAASKLAVDDGRAAGRRSKTSFTANDAGVTKGAAQDRDTIAGELRIAYGGAVAAFFVPPGADGGVAGWLSNGSTTAKFVNRRAPGGPSQTKTLGIREGRSLKLRAKGLGEVGLDLAGLGAPQGSVFTALCVTNGGARACHCSAFDACAFRVVGGVSKLDCRAGVPDDGCRALAP